MNHFINCYYAYTQLVPTDIYPIQYGEEQCESCHAFGPCIRSNYLLHYVYSGKGSFKNEQGEYALQEGQMFLIKPQELTYYQADANEPWLYRWIEFNGSMVSKLLQAGGFTEKQPILEDTKERRIGKMLQKLVEAGDQRYESLMQHFWGFLAALAEREQEAAQAPTHEYISKAESFIKINLHKKITVVDVAEYIGIDRSYLSRLFRQYKGISPQEYILDLKLGMAAYYLKNTCISISEVAQSVGYSDSRIFNKTFKSKYKTSPSEWRKRQLWEQSIII